MYWKIIKYQKNEIGKQNIKFDIDYCNEVYYVIYRLKELRTQGLKELRTQGLKELRTQGLKNTRIQELKELKDYEVSCFISLHS